MSDGLSPRYAGAMFVDPRELNDPRDLELTPLTGGGHGGLFMADESDTEQWSMNTVQGLSRRPWVKRVFYGVTGGGMLLAVVMGLVSMNASWNPPVQSQPQVVEMAAIDSPSPSPSPSISVSTSFSPTPSVSQAPPVALAVGDYVAALVPAPEWAPRPLLKGDKGTIITIEKGSTPKLSEDNPNYGKNFIVRFDGSPPMKGYFTSDELQKTQKQIVLSTPAPAQSSLENACTYSGDKCFELRMHKCQKGGTAGQTTIHGLKPLWTQPGPGFGPLNCTGDAFDMSLMDSIKKEMNAKWLSCPEDMGNNEKFWSHEWTKHGTCSSWDQLTFFKKGLAAFDESVGECASDTNECSVCFNNALSREQTCNGFSAILA